MAGPFSKFKDMFKTSPGEEFPGEFTDDYIELETEIKAPKAKVMIKPFIVEEFADIKPVLDALREGYTIGLVNIKLIKDKDIIELKRVVNKLKKTTEAINGDIAGFGDDWLVVTPSFATVYRTGTTENIKEN